jgi:ABC-type polysaccharide/polyol phosphate transport system ATPase subunit
LSVEFQGVGKLVRVGGTPRVLFRDLNFRIEPGVRVVIFGLPKSGKSTLLRMICGVERADSGFIERTSSVSWPMPLSSYLSKNSTVAANIKFMTRLYGFSGEDIVREIAEIGEISEFLNEKLSQCPKFVPSQLAFALGIGLRFEICLFDNRLAPVGKEFKPKALEIIKSLGPQRAIVLATKLPKEGADICDTVFVLENEGVTRFQDAEQGLEHFQAMLSQETSEEQQTVGDEPELVEEEVADDVAILGI